MGIIPGWENLDADTKTALIMAGATTAQGYFAGRGEDERADDTRRDAAIGNRAEVINQVLASETSDRRYGLDRDDANASAAARMSGSSPLQHQSQRAQMSAIGDFMGGAGRADMSGTPSHFAKHMPNGGAPIATTPFSSSTMNFFSPASMASAEKNYWDAQNNIDPRLEGPDLGAVGYGAPGTAVSSSLATNRQNRMADRETEESTYENEADARSAAQLAALDE
jgi:hypothetical protein